MQAVRHRSAWNYFPHAIIAALLVVVAVNAGMIWSALHTFPGVAQRDVFDESNNYDQVLAEAAQEAALGWKVQPVEGAALPTLVLADRDGQPLVGAAITAQARRPVGPDMLTPMAFVEGDAGHYLASAALPAAGQWELRLSIVHGGHTLHATRRIVVK